ncbi:MAG: LamB/YcsF family protein [archaeon GB-1867-035]|nr:LamB/YcsF family protein [Candidatus Culexmicrobium profundum]
MPRYLVDLNCDLGESFGRYKLGLDEEVMQYITSANIACGFHAGDPGTMKKTILLARKYNVKVGAHPGLPDILGFGRRWIEVKPSEVEEYTLYQIGALDAFARAAKVKLQHVKPHGALYNKAAVNIEIAEAIARAIAQYDDNLILVGLANSHLITAGEKYGLKVAREAFADRAYNPDGTLTPRKIKGAVIEDPEKVLERAVKMITEGITYSIDGKTVRIGEIDTICVHGDTPGAVEIARRLYEELPEKGIQLKPMSNIVEKEKQ